MSLRQEKWVNNDLIFGRTIDLSVSPAPLVTVAPSDKQTELSVSPAPLSYFYSLGQTNGPIGKPRPH